MAKTTLHQGVESVRDEIAMLLEELRWLDTALVPPDELKARITEAVAAEQRSAGTNGTLRSLATPTKDKFHTGTFGSMFAVETKATYLGTGPAIMPVKVEIASVLAWLLGDELTKNLHAKVDALQYTPGPPMAERPKCRAELLAALRLLEEKEEALICTGEEAGLLIARRSDADPAVVLGYDPKGSMTEVRHTPGVATPGFGVANAVRDQASAVQASAPAVTPSMAQAGMPSMGPSAMQEQARAAAHAGFKAAFLP